MMRKLTLGLLCVAVASAILSGCGGSGGSGSQSLLPSEPSVPITRGRLIQHGDEAEYNVFGVATYQGTEWKVRGNRVMRVRSVVGGVLEREDETTLELHRDSSPPFRIVLRSVLYLYQDRETYQVFVYGYERQQDRRRFNARLPYPLILPGAINQNSNFATHIVFENDARMNLGWQIGGWETVPTDAGVMGCYRIREESSWSESYPSEQTFISTVWFSPQLMTFARMETDLNMWIDDGDGILEANESASFFLTYLLRRTNVPLRPQTGAQAQ
jgi:hypothetical protein